uniref:C-type lectin domain-containing protein n=1 Tax=Coturnix japonica TaxID=93934 RepID=A0A8C2Y4V5_COTJA
NTAPNNSSDTETPTERPPLPYPRCELCSPCPEVSHVSHNAWVGFQGKCYYFSDTESAWNSSREHCQQLGASLTTIDSKEEMVRAGHEPQFRASVCLGGGRCAYLNGDRISSALCHLPKYWVCSRSNSTFFCKDGTWPQ